MGRLDKLYAITLGNGDAGVERFYQKLYAALANLYRASDRVELDEDFLLGAAAAILKTDAEFSAAIALTFRIALVNMFFAGDLYSGSRRRRRSEASAEGRRFAGTNLARRCAASRSRNISREFSRRTICAAGPIRPRSR